MAENSNIEWCDSTFNPWIGCAKVSPGCDHCYAESMMDHRMHKVKWGAGENRIRTSMSNWNQPVKWNRNAAEFQAKHGRRQRVFCASLADVFDNQVPEQWRTDLWRLIEETPNLDWLLLTKRIGNAESMLPMLWGGQGWGNVWLGATVVNQDEADRDIPKLLAIPAKVRFLSIEPMLGPISLFKALYTCCGEYSIGDEYMSRQESVCCGNPTTLDKLDWVICGGESGPHARPMHPDWPRSLRDQCADADVPFLFKQWGEWVPLGRNDAAGSFHEGYVRPCPNATFVRSDGFSKGPTTLESEGFARMHKIGKKSAGRLLDGVEHNGFPEI